MFCPKCGAKNPDGAKFCTTCGNPIPKIPVFQPEPVDPVETAEPVRQVIEPVEAVKPDVSVEPYTYTDTQSAYIPPADDLERRFFGKKADYYLRKRDKLSASHGKVSWNWAGFWLTYFWAFYRKMYALGGILFGLSALVSILGTFIDIIAHPAVSMAISLLYAVFVGLAGNYLYLNHADKCLAEARQMPPQEQNTYIAKKGGTSMGPVILVLVAVLILSGIRYAVTYQKFYDEMLAAYGVSNVDSSKYDTPDPDRPITQAPKSSDSLPIASIPSVDRTVDPTEFMGLYIGVDDTSEMLVILWDDFLLEFGCYGDQTTYFDGVLIYPYDDEPYTHFDGNSVRLNAQTVITDGFQYDITFTYVPADSSPYGADTIYMQSDDFKDAIYTRHPDSIRFEETPSDPGDDYYYDEELDYTPIVAEDDFPKLLNEYNGLHIEPHVPYDDRAAFTEGYGHVEVEVHLRAIDKSTMYVELTVTSHSDSSRVAEVSAAGEVEMLPSFWVSFEDDGWGNSGELGVYFLEDGKVGVVSGITEWGDYADWSLDLPYTELPSVAES